MTDICPNEKAIVQGETWRITVLTSSLIRLEYSSVGQFTDQATQMVANRNFITSTFRVDESDSLVVIVTETLRLTYNKKAFSSTGLKIDVCGNNSAYSAVWHYGDEPKDLGGTARTLDVADGAIDLEYGILSKEGWSILSDKASMLMADDGFITERSDPTAEDLYFFGYGRDYITCLKDFYKLTGSVPLLPRYALGNWWSRYYRYTQKSYLELMDRFIKENIPFTVSVIDMDWHITDVDPKYGTGWTGYTWNKDLFPNPKLFLQELKNRGLKTTLNVHPADGVRGFEDCYKAFAEFMNVDTINEDPVTFQPANRKFMEGYFNLVHHPLEDEGVDFWWIDWQQGNNCGVEGLDPLWMLNHFHYLDNCRNGNRGLIFSRYAGPGSHRYPVGFSGDTIVSWKSLDFQPYFTATASNIGYGWWSHDIGGHMCGTKDDEMALRWLQFGTFSPILRLHSTNSEFNSKEPWQYNLIVENIMKDFLRLRHKLIPYTYTMNRRANVDGEPILEPMYYYHPTIEDAYNVPNQYYFGSELIACPITTPINRQTGQACFSAWLPNGTWIDFFTGMVYEGGRRLDLYRSLDTIPILAKAGGIVPMDKRDSGNKYDNPDTLEIRVFGGENGTFSLWEDDGKESTYNEQHWAETKINFVWGNNAKLIINSPNGNIDVLPQSRAYKICIYGLSSNVNTMVTSDGIFLDNIKTNYHNKNSFLEIDIPNMPIDSTITITLNNATLSDNQVISRIFDFLNFAQIEFNTKTQIMSVIRELDNNRSTSWILSQLVSMSLNSEILGVLTEILTAY